MYHFVWSVHYAIFWATTEKNQLLFVPSPLPQFLCLSPPREYLKTVNKNKNKRNLHLHTVTASFSSHPFLQWNSFKGHLPTLNASRPSRDGREDLLLKLDLPDTRLSLWGQLCFPLRAPWGQHWNNISKGNQQFYSLWSGSYNIWPIAGTQISATNTTISTTKRCKWLIFLKGIWVI